MKSYCKSQVSERPILISGTIQLFEPHDSDLQIRFFQKLWLSVIVYVVGTCGLEHNK